MRQYHILLFFLTMLGACNNKVEEHKKTVKQQESIVELTDAQLANAKLTRGRIEKRTISGLLNVNGRIDVPPQNMVSVSAPLGGYLKATNLLPGMHVRKGEQIATMEDQQYITLQQEYLAAKAKLLFLNEEFKRQEELNKSKAVSDKTFQEVSMNYTQQKVLVKSLNEKLKLIGIDPGQLNESNLSRCISIKSPIDGYVSHVNMNIGKYANPSDVLFELVNPTDIHLELNVFEKDIDQLYIGQKLVAYTNHHPEKKYPCEVILIGKDLSQERSIEVHCHFENYDHSLIPGMFMNAEIEVQSHDAFAIPSDAIVQFEGAQYVFMQIDQHRFELQPVQTVHNENGYTQILFPANVDASGKTFVLKNAYTLLMKMKNTAEDEEE